MINKLILQDSEKDKFSPQYECTMLTDLSVDSIYIPPSRGVSPVQSDSESITPSNVIVPPPSSTTPISSRDVSPLKVTNHTSVVSGSISSPSIPSAPYHPPPDNKTWKIVLPHNASAETAAGWLAYNRSYLLIYHTSKVSISLSLPPTPANH